MLKIEHLTKVFYPGTVNEKLAINDVSLHIKEGEIVCVIGSNGSGKSTLFNLVSGTYPVTSGRIILDGKDVTNQPEHRRAFTIGRIFQDPTKGTAANMSVEDNLITASRKGMRGLRISLTDKKREEFRRLLKPIGLSDRLADNVGLLSGGQRQALSLLMTVLSNPKVIFLDEHTAALDPGNAATVMSLTQKYIAQYRLTAIMVTHNMQFAIDYGNRLIMMDEGQIILDASGDRKKELTVEKLVQIFKEMKKREFASDRGLLAI
ncbi:MAG: ABC transporter ATP-binding protein [Sphaerochaetaceae bacterium]